MRIQAAFVAVALLVSACATYRYDGVEYRTRQQASAAARADINAIQVAVKPAVRRLGGSVLIVVPSRAVIDQAGGRAPAMLGGADAAVFETDIREMNYLAVAEGVERGQVFDRSSVIRSPASDVEPADGYDYKLWLQLRPGENAQWYVARPGGGVAPVNFPAGISRYERQNGFNAELVREAGSIAGPQPGVRTVAAAATAQVSAGTVRTAAAGIWCVDPRTLQLYSTMNPTCVTGDRQVSEAEAYDIWPRSPPDRRPANRPPQPSGTASAPGGAARPQEPPTGQKGPRLVGTGTGFVISARSLIVTNHHVIEGCGEVLVRTREGSKVARVVARDAENDLALLRTDPLNTRIAHFREAPDIRLGDTIVAYGYPLIDILTINGNLTTGTVSGTSGIGDDSRFLQISAPIQPGNSGGPLLDTSGNVVGIVSQKLNAVRIAAMTGGDIPQNVNFAIRSSVARTFLEANDVTYTKAPSKTKLDIADVGDVAKGFTVLIGCFK
jgi:S1-C subfamily serine protease